jgi:BirA family transcriptional regulator, biotin operon repressor / biotin---[acetyl-CoA-carboxylase] ligase
LVELRPGDPQPQTLSLIAGLSLVEAIDLAVPGQDPSLKWPNDVLVRGKKLAGILLERTGNRVILGFGVNLASAPTLPDRDCAALSRQISPSAFAPLIAGSFGRLLALWRTSEPRLLRQAWLVRAHPLGTELRIHSSNGEMITGRFDGLEDDGALRLQVEGGHTEVVHAGDVEL